MLISLGIWFGTETAHHSNWGFRFWGMNYPLRFTLFGLIITLISIFIVPRIKQLTDFRKTSYVVGLLYLMISLWALSIFGNYSDWDRWVNIRQYEMFYWDYFPPLFLPVWFGMDCDLKIMLREKLDLCSLSLMCTHGMWNICGTT